MEASQSKTVPEDNELRRSEKQRPDTWEEKSMKIKPQYAAAWHKGTDKLRDKCAIITGGDSGIGRAVGVLFAREGCDIVCVYHEHDEDARDTQKEIKGEGRECLIIKGDIGDEAFCQQVAKQAVVKFGKINILVNNAAVQFPKEDIMDISNEQLEVTFRTNIFSMFYMTKACLSHMKKGDCIINSTSVTAYRGSSHLLDYASTKGAIVTFTRSLSQQLLDKGIRVNAVAPGPVYTPLITGSFDEKKIEDFGKKNAPMERPAQPEEMSPSYLFLACEQDSSYFTGQVLHPNGGSVVNA